MRVTASRLAALVLLTATSCGTSTPPELLTCEEGDLAISRELTERWTPSECASDADCVLYLADVRCPDGGAQYSWCELAVHRDEAGALQAALDGALAEVCPRIPSECRGGASCAPVVARCVEAHCVAASAPDGG